MMKREKSFSRRDFTDEHLAPVIRMTAVLLDKDLIRPPPSYWIKRRMKILDLKILYKMRNLNNLTHRQSAIRRPPGSRLNNIAAFIYYEKTYLNVFKPVISDMQSEYFEALHRKQDWKARWVKVCGICIFWKTVACHPLGAVVDFMKKVWTIAG